MEKIKINDVVKIQCYKHNGELYRNWDKSVILDITDEYIVCANNKVKVTEVDGRKWNTKEPAVLFFYRKRWFNIIAQFKKNGIFYYCNIATPFIIEDGTIKYIDYDLDLRVFPDFAFKVLDRSEYEYNKRKMSYSLRIDKIIKFELDKLIDMMNNKNGPFMRAYLEKYHDKYAEMIRMMS